MTKLASNLYWIRLLSGEPRKKFAERIGTSGDKLYTYESGRTRPNELVLHNICKLVGITLEQLEYSDLREYDIKVLNPETRDMEFILSQNQEKTQATEMQKRMELYERLLNK